jgi:hypothetical protein
VLAPKLNALNEHQSLDYRPSLAIARALREQIDWERLRQQTADSTYAKAFFTLVEELRIAPPRPVGAGRGKGPHGNVRVISG